MEPGVPDFTSRETLKGMYNLDKKLRFWATPPYARNLLDGTCAPSMMAAACPLKNPTDP
jgi:D-xylulose reductase